jgi:homoserine kinase
VKVTARAPATTANLGAGFDCAAVALDLWNEVVVSDGGTPDREHLGVQAFERIQSADGLGFEFYDRIPRERGLGSSAAVIALGLVTAAHVSGREPEPEWLLQKGLPLEGHADNLAAALAGGACLTSDGRVHRVADGVPAVPIALVPDSTVATAEARAALPEQLPLADAVFTVGRAALLGAGLASGSETVFAAALDDRVHEPYRASNAPLLGDVRGDPPTGALGATISGSGPTVMVWAHPHLAKECSVELSSRFPDVEVLWLSTSPKGAEVTS